MINNIRFKILARKINKIPEFYRIFARKMPNYIIRQRDRGKAEAKCLRPRLRPKFWPQGPFGLEDLTTLKLTTALLTFTFLLIYFLFLLWMKPRTVRVSLCQRNRREAGQHIVLIHSLQTVRLQSSDSCPAWRSEANRTCSLASRTPLYSPNTRQYQPMLDHMSHTYYTTTSINSCPKLITNTSANSCHKYHTNCNTHSLPPCLITE